MAHSFTQIELETGTAAGAGIEQRVFSFTFDYINTGDIKVIITNDPEDATPTYTTPLPLNKTIGGAYDSNGVDAANKKIILDADPDATAGVDGASELRIYRDTTLSPIVDFQGGSRIAEADLDNAYRQGLFAAQEVSENASTRGGTAHALTPDSVDHQHIVTDAVRADEIQADAVGTSELAANSVTTAITADTMNWSSEGSTIILPGANRNFSAVDANYGWTGTVAVARGGTGYNTLKTSNVLEKITGTCDGSTVTRTPDSPVAEQVLPNVTDIQTVTESWATVDGSSIAFIPHAEATRVEYEFSFTISKGATSQALTYFRLIATDEAGGSPTEVTKAKFTVGGGEYNGGLIHFKWVFGRYTAVISGEVDPSLGVFGQIDSPDPWNVARTLYLEVLREEDDLPTLARRKVAVSNATLISNVLTVTTATNWIDLDPGRTELVKVHGPWTGATTDPAGYYKATYVSNTSFTAALTGDDENPYSASELLNGYVYSWVPSDHATTVRLHTVPHHTDEATLEAVVRAPVLTLTSVK
jgi:hypothetical protein